VYTDSHTAVNELVLAKKDMQRRHSKLVDLPRADCQHLHASANPALHINSHVQSDTKVSLCAKMFHDQ